MVDFDARSAKKDSDLEALAVFLDSQFRGPFGFRFGWDGILGLIPGAGPFIASILSYYILLRAAWMRVTPWVVTRMFLNLLIENAIGVIPIVGQIFDFVWKANLKNLEILRHSSIDPDGVHRRSRIWVLVTVFTLFILSVSTIALGLFVFWKVMVHLLAYFG
jgi:hypothetical protein